MTDIFERVLLPIAEEEDARATARAFRRHVGDSVVAVHVVEKAGGAPDKASVEQRELAAEDAFDAVHEELQEYIRHRLLADDASAAPGESAATDD